MKDYPKSYLFSFLKYIKPIWYFNLRSSFEYASWVDTKQLQKDDLNLLDYPGMYQTEKATQADLAYQAWQKGLLVEQEKALVAVDKIKNVSDEYCFIARFYNKVWLIYILFIRLLTLHNPFKELNGFIKASRIKRINPSTNPKFRPNIKTFDSHLIHEKPFVSVIIPTLNRYSYLRDVLLDLEKQTYQHFEVLICDQSDSFDEAFYNGYKIDIKLLRQDEKALWLARNRCVKQSQGELILLFDDDSRVEPDWIEMHIRCLDYFKADISSGISISKVGAKVPDNYNCYRWSDQLDTGNAMLYKRIFSTTGLFDRQFEKQRMGDGEFGLRCYLAGFVNINNPDALRLHLKVSTGGLRQMGSWDAFRTKSLFAPRPIPSVLYLTRKYYGTKSALNWLLIRIPPSIIPYKWKSSSVLTLLAFFVLPIIFPFILIQIIISWKRASGMLNAGDKIEFLKENE